MQKSHKKTLAHVKHHVCVTCLTSQIPLTRTEVYAYSIKLGPVQFPGFYSVTYPSKKSDAERPVQSMISLEGVQKACISRSKVGDETRTLSAQINNIDINLKTISACSSGSFCISQSRSSTPCHNHKSGRASLLHRNRSYTRAHMQLKIQYQVHRKLSTRESPGILKV